MKKIVLVLFFLLFSTFAKAQMSGSFIVGNDGMVYFALTNTTNYNLQFQWYVVNDYTQEQKGNVQTIGVGQTLYFGPQSIGWTWLSGERFIAILGNGQSGQWTCPDFNSSSSSPSFKGSRYKTDRIVQVKGEYGTDYGYFPVYREGSYRYIKFKKDSEEVWICIADYQNNYHSFEYKGARYYLYE